MVEKALGEGGTSYKRAIPERGRIFLREVFDRDGHARGIGKGRFVCG